MRTNSRLFYEGTVAPTDMDRATDARAGGRLGVFGTSLAYGAGDGSAASEALGCELNPGASPLIAWAPGMEPPWIIPVPVGQLIAETFKLEIRALRGI